MTAIDVSRLVRQIPTQYPFVMVDRVLEHDPAGRLLAVKNVTGSEEFFEGHFPGAPVMPGVLIMESLAQAAGIWLLLEAGDPSRAEVHVVGIDEAKFRRPVVPGDQLTLEIRVLRRRGGVCRVRGEARAGDQRVAEADLLLRVTRLAPSEVDPTARVAHGATLGPGVRVGPYCVVGPRVRIGAGSVLESHVVVDGDTVLGRGNRVFPFASIGLEPQDLKFRGEDSRVVIGDGNLIREFVTIHRGTAGGGGVTSIGDRNLLMAHVHVAHDCRVGSRAIFANGATLAGHVEVMDDATVGAYSGVHQFCRVGSHAFVGGFTVATKDVLPYSKTVGNRACLYGVNSVGLKRRGFSPEAVATIKRAFRILLNGGGGLAEVIDRLEAELPGPEVRTLAEFVRSSSRGVILKRRRRRRAPADE